MAGYATFTTTRPTVPDQAALLAAVKSATGDPTAVLFHLSGATWRGKKADAWTAPQIAAAQNVLDTTAALTPQLEAQRNVDAFPIEYRALVLALIDEINLIRAALPTPLAARTPAQAITAIRNKAGTL